MKKLLIITSIALLASSKPLMACCQGDGEPIAERLVLPPTAQVVSDLCNHELEFITQKIPVHRRTEFLDYYETRMLYFESEKLPKIQRIAKEMEQRFPELFPTDEISVKRRAEQSVNMERYIKKLYHNEFISDWFRRHT